jgi:superfamily II DNA or RNA helicase
MSLAVAPPPTLDQKQAEALDAVLGRRRSGSRSSILQMATGLGKTRVAGNYTRHARREWGGRTLFLCDSRELVNQTAAEFKDAGIPFAVEMGPYRAAAALRVADPWAVIGSKDSLYAERIVAFRPDCFSEVVVDECFPRGTLIDGRPIQTIKKGDWVRSFNHLTHQLELRRVVGFMSRKCRLLVRVHLSDGSSVVCTPNHPFFAWRIGHESAPGYRPAKYLTFMDRLYRMAGDDPQFASEEMEDEGQVDPAVSGGLRRVREAVPLALSGDAVPADLFSGVQGRPAGEEAEGGGRPVRDVRGVGDVRGAGRPGDGASGPGLLLGVVQGRRPQREDGEAPIPYRPDGMLGAHEGQEPDARPCDQSEDDRVAPQDGLEAEGPGRQWPVDGSAGPTGGSPGMADGGRGQDRMPPEGWERMPHLLQARHRECEPQGWGRGGRGDTPDGGREGEGCQEGRLSRHPWVAGVEVLQPGGDGEFERLCPDGLVYNLEVEVNNNYFVHGLLVHNCHVSLAPTWKEVLAYFAPARHILALTATPYRFDGQPLYDAPGAPYEGIAYRYRLPEAVANGHLAEVHSVTRHAGVNLKDVRVSRTTKDFSRGALEDRISRNVEPLVNVVRREIEDLGLKKVLLFSPDVSSALAFAEAFRKVGVPAKGVHGGSKAHPMSDPTRDRIIREHKEGAFPVLCSCDLLTTGYNDPWIEAVVMCRPTKSYGLAMQMAGRCTRRPPGKDHCYVIGFAWEGAEGVVSSVDFFLEDEPDPKVRIIAKRLQGLNRGIPDRELVERAREIAALDAQREAEEEDRRRLRLQVRKKEVHCKRIEFTPYTAGQIVGIAPVVRELDSGAFEPMAESQREFLRGRGMSDLTGLDRAGAETVIRRILDNDFRRLAGPDQVTELIRAGHSPEVARRMELAKAEDELRRVRQRVEAEAAARAAKQAGDTSKSAAIHHAKPVSPKMRTWLARRGYPPERIDRMGQGEAVRIFLDVTGKGRRARA